MSRYRAASVRARLLNVAKATGTDFNLALVRFALERLLYRLPTSAHADRFALKGALLFTRWYDLPGRSIWGADPGAFSVALRAPCDAPGSILLLTADIVVLGCWLIGIRTSMLTDLSGVDAAGHIGTGGRH